MNTRGTLVFVVLVACGLLAVTFGLAAAPSTAAPMVQLGGQLNLGRPPIVVTNASFISPLVELFGDVWIGRKVFIASNTVVRADPGTRICLGHATNLQDNITFLAVRNTPAPHGHCGRLASSTDDDVSIAHQATIKNSRIGRFTFVGFRAYLENVTLEDGAFVLHAARITNVTIRQDRLVPIGAVITTQAEADALPFKTDANSEFQHEVLEVNAEFAEHYPDLYFEGGFDAVTGVGSAPRTSWNPEGSAPTIAENVRLDEFVRIVGDVRLGTNSSVGRRSAIRADEGSPIIIGHSAHIENRVTFHALKGTSIVIGNGLHTGDNIVIHGPLEVGDNLVIGDNAILFRSKVGHNVTLGDGAVVVGVTLRNGARVPSGAIITRQEQADEL